MFKALNVMWILISMPPVTSPSNINPDDLPYRPCAGVLLVNSDGLVFSGRRIGNHEPGSKAWQMPQGGIDEGESPGAAALREMEEEVGTRAARLVREMAGWITYDLPPDLLGKTWKGRYRGQKQKWFAFVFEGTDSDIDIETEHPEFVEWQWMRASELLERTVDFKRSVYERVFEEFSDLLKT